MKMIAEYLEHAVQFELLARFEENPKLKADFDPISPASSPRRSRSSGTAIGWSTDPQRAPAPMARPARARCRIAPSRQASSSQRFSSSSLSASTSSHRSFSTRDRRIPMNKLLAHAAFAVGIIASSAVMAADRTITLAVNNMDCAACPSIVKGSLEAVPGVAKVAVSFKDKTATIIYDDAKADVNQLTSVTTKAGYPSAPKS